MKRTYFSVLASTFLFSSMEISLKIAGAAFNAIQLNLLRFFIGGLVLVPLALHDLHKQHRQLHFKDWGLFALTGFVCVIVSMTLFQLAVQNAPAATVAVLFSCNPVFALIFAFLLLHERMGRANFLAVIVSLLGLFIIVNPFRMHLSGGVILALLSAVTFGLYSIVSRYGSTKRELSGIVMTCFTFLAGTVELFILMVLTHWAPVATGMAHVAALHEFIRMPLIRGISWHTLPLLAYIGIGVTGGGFALYFLAMEWSDVSTASLVFFIKPALAPILAMIILHEVITGETITGIVVILLGSLITFIGNRNKERNLG